MVLENQISTQIGYRFASRVSLVPHGRNFGSEQPVWLFLSLTKTPTLRYHHA